MNCIFDFKILKFLLSIAFVVPHIDTKFRLKILRIVGDFLLRMLFFNENVIFH